MKRGVEFQTRVTKMNLEQKELNVRIRKVNAELEIQRKNNIQMKNEMGTKIEELQSNKENYLLEEIERLKGTIEEDRGDREDGLLQETTQLRAHIFQLEEGLKVATIKLNLADRKKQQAVSEAIDKKEQEMKVQKLLAKSLH